MSLIDLSPDTIVADEPLAYRMPLVIGVTGHRDVIPGDVDLLKQSVLKVFNELKQQYPHTPLLLLSPLAEGADRLVADVALDCGVDLVAPLPMKQELYEEDFRPSGTPAGTLSPSQQEFRALLGKTKRHFEMPLVPGSTWDQVAAKTGGARELQYLLVGLYVARHCQILLALWDGSTSGSAGGTWQIVKLKQTGQLPDLSPTQLDALEKLELPYGYRQSILEAPDAGPVYHVPTRRQKSHPTFSPLAKAPEYLRLAPGGSHASPASEKPGVPLASRRRMPRTPWQKAIWYCFWRVNDGVGRLVQAAEWLVGVFRQPKPSTPEAAYFQRLGRVHRHIDTFNRLVGTLLLTHEWKGKRESLISKQELPAISQSVPAGQHAALQRLASAYAVADMLALHFQARTLRTLKMLIFMVLGGVVLFGIYAHLGGEGWKLWFVAGYIFVLASADSFYLAARNEDQQNKHQDYRTLAEGLRVQYYWRLAGMSESAADHYLSKQRSELDWIRHAVQAWGVLTPVVHAPQFPLVGNYWIKHPRDPYYGQANYYHSAGPRDLHYAILYRELGSGFLMASLALAALAALFGENLHFWEYLRHFPPIAHAALVLALPVAVAIGVRHLRVKFKELKEEKAFDGGEEFSLHLRYGIAGMVFALLLFVLLMGIRELLLWLTGVDLPDARLHERLWKTDIQDWLIVGMATFALMTALLHTYAERRGFAEQHKQYERMAAVFERARIRLDQLVQSNNAAAAQNVLADLGHEALAEHGDWLLLHRERPMEMPKVEL